MAFWRFVYGHLERRKSEWHFPNKRRYGDTILILQGSNIIKSGTKQSSITKIWVVKEENGKSTNRTSLEKPVNILIDLVIVFK